MTVSLYVNRKTWVHQLDGRTKLLMVLGIFVLAMCFSHPGYLLGVLAVVIAGLAVAQAGANVKKIGILAALLVCYSIVLWPFFVNGKTPVLGLQLLGVTWEGCVFGLGMGMRLLIMVWGGVWLLSTTTIEELAQASQRLGLASRVGFVFSLAFRWVGVLLGAGIGVIQAQRARGLDLSSGNILERISRYVPLIVPLIGHTLRQTNLVAMALECKGFHPIASRSFYHREKLKRRDYAVLCFLGIALGMGAWLKWQGIGTLNIRF